jgi:hypothetical protein
MVVPATGSSSVSGLQEHWKEKCRDALNEPSEAERLLIFVLQAGCIPVLFHRSSAYDVYTSFLPSDESSYSVFIPDQDVLSGGIDIIETLQSIPEAEVERKRSVIAGMLQSISYGNHIRALGVLEGGDRRPVMSPLGEESAYEIALAEALRRVQRAVSKAKASGQQQARIQDHY